MEPTQNTPAAQPVSTTTVVTTPDGVTRKTHTLTGKEGPHQVSFVAYPKMLFTWPLILVGYLFAVFGATNDAGMLETLAWIYIWVATIVILTLATDIDRNRFVFLIVFIALVWFAGLWLRDTKHFTLFGDIYRWFAGLDIQYSTKFGLAISIFLSVPFVATIAWAHINDRWRITHNEFEHYSFGRSDDTLGRGAKSIRTSFPDILELALGLAGTLVVYNANGTQELRRIPHVMFLPMIRKRLDSILARTAVTETMGDEEEDQ